MARYKKNVGAFVHYNGVSFRVWAPNAESVGVVGTFAAEEIPMLDEKDGYWHVLVKEAEAGQEYKFAIHTKDKVLYRNDPRALHLTTSRGFSVIVDNKFDWEDDDFTPPPREQQVVYEMHVGTYYRPDAAIVGTFDNALEKLDHLVELGINMIEVMPINTMLDDRGWGYAPDYIYAVESLYGGRHGFLEFVKAAHKRGIGVILDVVYNHFGPDDQLDLWQFDGWSENDKGGIFFYNDWRGDTPWGSRPDYGRYEVQQYLLDNLRMWLHDCHVDGLRVDSTIYLRNTEGNDQDPAHDIPEAWHFMQLLNEVAKKAKPDSIMVAEDMACNEYITKHTNDGGAGFDTQWELGMPHVLRAAMGSDKPHEIHLDGLEFELTRRYNGDAFQRMGFVDSHDTAANGSSRFCDVISGGKGTELYARQRQLIAAGIVMTAPMIPMLLQGQEIQETGDFNDWRSLDWDKTKEFPGIFLAHQHLIDLRKNTHGVTGGLLGQNINISHVNDDEKVMVYQRWNEGGPRDDVLVVINFGSKEFDEYVIGFPRNGEWKVRFNSSWTGYSDDFLEKTVESVHVTEGSGTLPLPAASILILSQDK